MRHLILVFPFILCNAFALFSQNQENVTPPRVANFTTTASGNGYKFTASELPLYQIAGAPQAYWSYYWEFGDGTFSFENDPVHIYEHPGNYSPLLEVTAHYDDGDKPKGKMGTAVAERS
ncbi:MAG: PKD domain-containing protein, partial [Saprospiraceae bacterium]|nr:PKD domain-containing protein [Saprospiraceae bacterium]